MSIARTLIDAWVERERAVGSGMRRPAGRADAEVRPVHHEGDEPVGGPQVHERQARGQHASCPRRRRPDGHPSPYPGVYVSVDTSRRRPARSGGPSPAAPARRSAARPWRAGTPPSAARLLLQVAHHDGHPDERPHRRAPPTVAITLKSTVRRPVRSWHAIPRRRSALCSSAPPVRPHPEAVPGARPCGSEVAYPASPVPHRHRARRRRSATAVW